MSITSFVNTTGEALSSGRFSTVQTRLQNSMQAAAMKQAAGIRKVGKEIKRNGTNGKKDGKSEDAERR